MENTTISWLSMWRLFFTITLKLTTSPSGYFKPFVEMVAQRALGPSRFECVYSFVMPTAILLLGLFGRRS
jgi:hypothetical protein